MTDPISKTVKIHENWFHGSPAKLTTLKPGSSITPFIEVAKAYSHKPKHLVLSLSENSESGNTHVEVKHDGVKYGYLYEVMISNPRQEMRLPVENLGPLGEEMVTTQDNALRLIEENEATHIYSFDLEEG